MGCDCARRDHQKTEKQQTDDGSGYDAELAKKCRYQAIDDG
jgi:hypothetical protein